jgi:hypothetical protein
MVSLRNASIRSSSPLACDEPWYRGLASSARTLSAQALRHGCDPLSGRERKDRLRGGGSTVEMARPQPCGGKLDAG